MQIEITHFRPLDNPHIKAVASILIDGQLAVHDIKILQYSPEKLIVTMPNKPDNKGIYRDMVHPINQELRQQINTLLLEEYNKRQVRNDK